MMKVKICGITNLEDARICEVEGADALGFIFSRMSPRCITKFKAKKIINNLGPFITKVGVFVDEDKNKVFDLAHLLSLDVLQFHGSESPSYCAYFKSKFKVIKALFAERHCSFKKRISQYKVDAYLFDVKYEEKVRGRKKLSPHSLKEISALIKEEARVIISGGINANNILSIKKLSPYGVDVARGVERAIGKKDKDLVRIFIQRAKR